MSVLVVGGAGYIGSHTVYELIHRGKDVVIVDNLQTGFKELIHPDAKFYQGDLRDKSFLHEVFEKENIEGVIHFAANSLVGVSMKEPLEYFNNNVYGMIVLLEVMKEHNVKYIVFSSTAATYGEPERIPIEETDATVPTNPYGETKLTMEKIMKWCEVAYGMHYVALRYFNACGAHPNGKIGELHDPETHLIPLILQVPLGKERLSAYLVQIMIQKTEPVFVIIFMSVIWQTHIFAQWNICRSKIGLRSLIWVMAKDILFWKLSMRQRM